MGSNKADGEQLSETNECVMDCIDECTTSGADQCSSLGKLINVCTIYLHGVKLAAFCYSCLFYKLMLTRYAVLLLCVFSYLLVVILSWFVDKTVVERAIKSDQLVEEEEVEYCPEKISDAVLDENIDICII